VFDTVSAVGYVVNIGDTTADNVSTAGPTVLDNDVEDTLARA
jgi:hypothetical protein